jgi:small neutral amino acid transporter SnatA (MarC family)
MRRDTGRSSSLRGVRVGPVLSKRLEELSQALAALPLALPLFVKPGAIAVSRRHQYMPPIPAPGIAASFFCSGMSQIIASVVSRSDAIDEAF